MSNTSPETSEEQLANRLTATFREVHEVERKLICQRRIQAGLLKPEQVTPDDQKLCRDDLVGLALSGGGLRSAMFNLGLLQAFQSSGLMRYVDYLSTVSGGGYVGGFYTAIGCQPLPPKTAVESQQQRNKPEGHPDPYHEDLPKLKDATRRFINAGLYLQQPWSFLSQYVRTSIWFVLTYLCGLVCLASLSSLLFRSFDLPVVRDVLELMNLESDTGAILVGIVAHWLVLCFVSWIIGWKSPDSMVSLRRQGNWIYWLLISIACGVAIFFGNYDVALMGSDGSWRFGNQTLASPLLLLALLAGLALFRLPLLMKSDRATAQGWQRVFLWGIVLTTVGGGSLAILSYVGKENFSGYASRRGPALVESDIRNDRGFLAAIDDLQAEIKPVPDWQPTVGQFRQTLGEAESSRDRAFPEKHGRSNFLEDMFCVHSACRLLGWLTWLDLGDYQPGQYITNQRKLRTDREMLVKEFGKRVLGSSVNNPQEAPDSHVTDKLLSRFIGHVYEVQGANPNTTNIQTPTNSAVSSPNTEPIESVKRWKAIHDHLAQGSRGLPYLEQKSFLALLSQCEQRDGKILWTRQSNGESKDAAAVQVFHRQLLELTYPEVFKERRFVSTAVVVGHDQWARFWTFLVSFALFGIGFRTVDLNGGAVIHQFYRDRLSLTFIKAAKDPSDHPGGALQDATPADNQLSELKPWRNGFPYPLIVAALKLPGRIDLNALPPDQLGVNPAKIDGSVSSEWYSFLLSPKFVGYLPCLPGRDSLSKERELRTYKQTRYYLNDRLRLSDAVTLSGAAVTPWMTRNPLLNTLMHAVNLRLEQWLPNPAWSVSELAPAEKQHEPIEKKFTLQQFLDAQYQCSTLKGRQNWKWGVVADGGFREFLGVEELIARRCRVVIVSDAGCNNGLSEFGVLADLVRQLRLDHGVEILDLDHELPMETERIRRQENGRVIQHFLVGRIRYPKAPDNPQGKLPTDGLFVYLQMSLTGDEEIDLAQFQKINPRFPDEPITNQFYSPDQVESLRQLGEHVGHHLCQRLDAATILKEGDPELRLNMLQQGLIAAYLLECRQETQVDANDTSPDWPAQLNHQGKMSEDEQKSLERFEKFEEDGKLCVTIAHFAARVLNGYDRDMGPKDYEGINPPDAKCRKRSGRKPTGFEITPGDLASLAVECNRRHAGFRSKNPTRFFRVGGRRLLMRSMLRALDFQKKWKKVYRTESHAKEKGAEASERAETDWLKATNELLRLVSQLATMLVDGVFRHHGAETARDVTLCVLEWHLEKSQATPNHTFGQSLDDFQARVKELFSLHRYRQRLLISIRTGLAAEVERVLGELLPPSPQPPMGKSSNGLNGPQGDGPTTTMVTAQQDS